METKTCPREPTVAMAAAGQWAQLRTVNPPVDMCVEANALARKIWAAMWAAVPEMEPEDTDRMTRGSIPQSHRAEGKNYID
jgi:hypothetical protein